MLCTLLSQEVQDVCSEAELLAAHFAREGLRHFQGPMGIPQRGSNQGINLDHCSGNNERKPNIHASIFPLCLSGNFIPIRAHVAAINYILIFRGAKEGQSCSQKN
jgi:hypothetical protein